MGSHLGRLLEVFPIGDDFAAAAVVEERDPGPE